MAAIVSSEVGSSPPTSGSSKSSSSRRSVGTKVRRGRLSAMGPRGVSMAARSAAASGAVCRPGMGGRPAAACRTPSASRPSRSGALKSMASITAWTSVPKAAPPGTSAMGEGTPRHSGSTTPVVVGRAGEVPDGLVVEHGFVGFAADPGVVAGLVVDRVGDGAVGHPAPGRVQPPPEAPDVERPSSPGAAPPRSTRSPVRHRRTVICPPVRAASVSIRATTAPSEGTSSNCSGTAPPSGRMSSRARADLWVYRSAAHHTTTWWRARVRAT